MLIEPVNFDVWRGLQVNTVFTLAKMHCIEVDYHNEWVHNYLHNEYLLIYLADVSIVNPAGYVVCRSKSFTVTDHDLNELVHHRTYMNNEVKSNY